MLVPAVTWEALCPFHGVDYWTTYDPWVSSELEKVYLSGDEGGCLMWTWQRPMPQDQDEEMDPEMVHYHLFPIKKLQVNVETGTTRRMRRIQVA